MAEFKQYVDGQQIEPSKPRVYTTVEEQAELKAYREFGDLHQLRVLCERYHELLNELKSRPTEAEIRTKVIDEFLDKLLDHETKNWVDHLEYGITWSDLELVAKQFKEDP